MLRVATYNVHDCVGRDGVYSPARIVEVIVALEVDVIALQEVTLDHDGDLLATLEAGTGLQVLDGTIFDRGAGRYGNVLLSRHAVVEQTLRDLSFRRREPRGVVDAVFDVCGQPVRVLATHLGLIRGERAVQIARISEFLSATSGPAVLMGDFNVWFGTRAFKPITESGFVQAPVPSYPTWPLPLLPLDRIFVRTPAIVEHLWRHDSPLAKIASDHHPVVANLAFSAGRPLRT